MNLITFSDELYEGICITATVGKDMNERLNQIAQKEGVSKAAVVRTFLRYGIQNYSKQNPKKQ